MIVVGGYHGSVTGDLLGYKLPSTLAASDTPCHLYGSYNSCAANPRCGWCGSSGGKESFVILSSPASLVFILFIVNTLSSSPSHLVILCRQVPPDLRGVPLQQQPQVWSCPSIYPAVSTCYSCTDHGGNRCQWCVHTGKCTARGGTWFLFHILCFIPL